MDEVPDSPAELAAIEPGNIIFGVDTKVTRDISQFVNYIEGGKSPRRQYRAGCTYKQRSKKCCCSSWRKTVITQQKRNQTDFSYEEVK